MLIYDDNIIAILVAYLYDKCWFIYDDNITAISAAYLNDKICLIMII